MAINALGKKRYSVFNCWTEDISILFIIFNLANSFIFVNKYGIFHLKSKITNTYKLKREHKIFAEIYLLDIILQFSKDNYKAKKFAVFKAYNIWNKIKHSSLNNINRLFLISILKKILLCKFIIQDDKKQINYIIKKLKKENPYNNK